MNKKRINFAETPFINIKIPTIILIVVGSLAIVGLLLNISLALLNGGSYIKQRKLLKEQSQTKEALEKKFKEITESLSTKDFSSLSKEAIYLNDVLAKKKFSWLIFLNRLEKVKPYKSIFQSISPKTRKDGTFYIKVKGLAQPREEIFKLEENIFQSEYFGKPHLVSEELDKTTTWQAFEIEFLYFPEGKK